MCIECAIHQLIGQLPTQPMYRTKLQIMFAAIYEDATIDRQSAAPGKFKNFCRLNKLRELQSGRQIIHRTIRLTYNSICRDCL